jgi:uncharacterized protein YndB with AHSA1/START domain
MNVMISPAPVRKTIQVKASQERAFEVFTAGMGRWWVKGHSINTSPQQDVIVEPREGGRWYERGKDGSECQWGHVIEWDPPRRLLLAWQIGADWRFDPALVTELEVRFTPEGPNATRVDLEHRNLDRFGEKAAETRASLDGAGGWTGLLKAFAEASSS